MEFNIPSFHIKIIKKEIQMNQRKDYRGETMKINLSKGTFKEKILKSNLLSFLVIFIFSFISLYVVITLFCSFIYFEFSSNIFNIGKWDIIFRIPFTVFWIYISCTVYSFKKDLL